MARVWNAARLTRNARLRPLGLTLLRTGPCTAMIPRAWLNADGSPRRSPAALEGRSRWTFDATGSRERGAPGGCLGRARRACAGRPGRPPSVELHGGREDRFFADDLRGAGVIRLHGRLGLLPAGFRRPVGLALSPRPWSVVSARLGRWNRRGRSTAASWY